MQTNLTITLLVLNLCKATILIRHLTLNALSTLTWQRKGGGMRRGTQLNKIKLLVFLQLFFLNLPLTLYLAYFLELNNTTTSSKAASQNHLFQFSHSYVLHSLKKGLGHFVFVLMFIWQASSSFNLIYTYGVMSFMLSPAKSWSLILVLYLFWRVHRPRMR